MSPELPPFLRDLPASAATIAEHLLEGDPMTGKELRDATGLPRRTIYSGLCRLRELGLLREQASLRDTRQRYLWLDLNGTPHKPSGAAAAAPPGPDRNAHPLSSARRGFRGVGA